MEFPLIGAGHPFPVVLMNSRATNLLGPLFSFSLGVVKASAVPVAGKGEGRDSDDDCEWDGEPVGHPGSGGMAFHGSLPAKQRSQCWSCGCLIMLLVTMSMARMTSG